MELTMISVFVCHIIASFEIAKHEVCCTWKYCRESVLGTGVCEKGNVLAVLARS